MVSSCCFLQGLVLLTLCERLSNELLPGAVGAQPSIIYNNNYTWLHPQVFQMAFLTQTHHWEAKLQLLPRGLLRVWRVLDVAVEKAARPLWSTAAWGGLAAARAMPCGAPLCSGVFGVALADPLGSQAVPGDKV